MTYGEAVALLEQLAVDQSSHVFVALNGWEHPWSAELELQASQWDLLARVNTPKGKRPPTYPRPWPSPDSDRSQTARPEVSQADVRAALNRMRVGQVEQVGEPEDN